METRADGVAEGPPARDRRRFPMCSLGVSLRRVFPELEQCTGTLVVQARAVCPLGPEGVSAAELPLRAGSPAMDAVVRNIAAYRRECSRSRTAWCRRAHVHV